MRIAKEFDLGDEKIRIPALEILEDCIMCSDVAHIQKRATELGISEFITMAALQAYETKISKKNFGQCLSDAINIAIRFNLGEDLIKKAALIYYELKIAHGYYVDAAKLAKEYGLVPELERAEILLQLMADAPRLLS